METGKCRQPAPCPASLPVHHRLEECNKGPMYMEGLGGTKEGFPVGDGF